MSDGKAKQCGLTTKNDEQCCEGARRQYRRSDKLRATAQPTTALRHCLTRGCLRGIITSNIFPSLIRKTMADVPIGITGLRLLEIGISNTNISLVLDGGTGFLKAGYAGQVRYHPTMVMGFFSNY